MFTKKGDAAVLAKLGDAPAQYRMIGERLHAIIGKARPRSNRSYAGDSRSTSRTARTSATSNRTRTSSHSVLPEVVNPARDEGASMHPVAWTLTSLDDPTEAKIRALIKKAVA